MPWRRRALSNPFLISNTMKTKVIVISILTIVVLVGGIILLSMGNNGSSVKNPQVAGNVSMVDGKQIITINAKGGYLPKATTAKAGVPTVITMKTRGTFDCSSALNIPSLGISKNLPPSGATSIDVPPQIAGTVLSGVCSMGMHSFAINFN